MSEPKIYAFGNEQANCSNMLALLAPMMQNRGLDPNVVLSMMNNRNNNSYGYEGMWFIWIWFMMMMWGNGCGGYGFGGFGGRGNGQGDAYLANMLNNDTGRELLAQAIGNNKDAINSLANMFNSDINTVQRVLNTMSGQICQVGNQVGMSGQQVINAIQQGNMNIAQQLASCCCDIRESVTKSNYDNQIATLNQTNQISGQINNVATGQERGFSNLGFITQQQTCAIKGAINEGIQRVVDGQNAAILRERDLIINKQNDELNAFKTAGIIGQQLGPINGALAQLQSEVNAIKCAQPSTVTLPNPCAVAMPTCVAYQYGLGNYPYGAWG